ncbi:MAG: alkaline phosphatase [Lentisphaerae bacterium]|nr:alkaline phosphatase [Lentisphaerota bacterium]
MGPAQVQVGQAFLGAPLSFETFPHKSTMTTSSANAPVTDSAAAGTAMAAGRKANNGVISMAIPGSTGEVLTVLEYLQERTHRCAGLVTTAYMTDATPAVFGAHEPVRGNTAQIADDYLSRSRPRILLGGGGQGLSPAAAQAAGYVVVTNRAELLALDPHDATPVSGQFSNGNMPYEWDGYGGLPHLAEMTAVALAALEDRPEGFFLMVEGGRIDHACHINDINRCVPEVLEFSRAVAVATNWAAGRTDTLIVVTADHETGGLKMLQDLGAGTNPVVSWSTTGHTATPVQVFAWGASAALATNVVDNTGIFDFLIAGALLEPLCVGLEEGDTPFGFETRWAGVAGYGYRLERASILAQSDWDTVAEAFAASGPLIWVDTNATANGPFYYRMISLR